KPAARAGPGTDGPYAVRAYVESINPRGATEMFKNVVIGVDGRDGGRDAIALARVLCDPDGELTLAHVYRGDPPAPCVSWPPLDAADDERIRSVPEKARAQAGV